MGINGARHHLHHIIRINYTHLSYHIDTIEQSGEVRLPPHISRIKKTAGKVNTPAIRFGDLARDHHHSGFDDEIEAIISTKCCDMTSAPSKELLHSLRTMTAATKPNPSTGRDNFWSSVLRVDSKLSPTMNRTGYR